MAKEWIEKLANDIKHVEHDAAEALAKQNHNHLVMTSKGKIFFDNLIGFLRQDITELNQALIGDVTAQSTTINQSAGPTHITIQRPHFPEVNATLAYSVDKIVFIRDNKQGTSSALNYGFHVCDNDGLSVREMVGEDAKHFDRPDELAKCIMETLFTVKKEN